MRLAKYYDSLNREALSPDCIWAVPFSQAAHVIYIPNHKIGNSKKTKSHCVTPWIIP